MSGAAFVPVDGEPYFSWWQERFGIPPGRFRGLGCYRRGRSTVWVAPAGMAGLVEGLPAEAVGLPFLRIGGRRWKPTTTAIVAFASAASRNAVDLEPEEARRFLAGEAVALPEGDPRRQALEPGYVVARLAGVALGCGEWRAGQLLSHVPKGRRTALAML